MRLALSLIILIAASVHAQTAPGKTHWGTSGYVEYIEGNLPIVLAAPHGGYLEPTSIRNRSYGVLGQDRRTQELARTIRTALGQQTGRTPHLIICHLRRTKLDANREIVEAAQGNRAAELAWREFHAFIDRAKRSVVTQYGRGHFYDIHGHGHPTDWVELGYALTASDLAKSDAQLRNATFIAKSTIRALATKPGIDFPDVLRGPLSLGGLLQARGYRAVPSPGDPSPNGRAYFSGGYNTRRHGSRDGGTIDGTQLEHSWPLRQGRPNHARYASVLAASMQTFFLRYHKLDLTHGGTVSVAATRPHASERGAVGHFVFSRRGDLSQPQTFRFEVEGTAIETIDFRRIPRSVTFAANERSKLVRLVAIDDRLSEGWESVRLRLVGGPEIGRPAATVLIHDDDGHPSLEAELSLDRVDLSHTPDTSGKSRHARLLPNAQIGPRIVPGKHGYAMSFDGSNDALQLPRLRATSSELSVAFWFRARKSRTSGFRYVFSIGSWARPQTLNIYFNESNGHLRTIPVYRNALVTDPVILDIEADLMDDRWHHYAMAMRPGEVTRVWLDGQLRGEAMLAGDTWQPTGDIFVGRRATDTSSRYYLGSVDDLRIYSRAIDRAEVADLFGYRPGTTSPVGAGCTGSRGIPAMELGPALDVGDDLAIQLANGPSSRPVLYAVGGSASSWNRVPLPIDLGPFGARGCMIRTSIDLPIAVVTDANGRASLALPTPFAASLVGKNLFGQFTLFDESANRLGLTTSNAVALRFGGIR